MPTSVVSGVVKVSIVRSVVVSEEVCVGGFHVGVCAVALFDQWSLESKKQTEATFVKGIRVSHYVHSNIFSTSMLLRRCLHLQQDVWMLIHESSEDQQYRTYANALFLRRELESFWVNFNW